MNLTFYGAAREVTGSCFYLESGGKKFLIDCGLQQGQDEKDDQKLPFDASEIDFVILTHAHIDHSGRLPLLAKGGFKGDIYATGATCDLMPVMLRDSAGIQEMDARWKNKKGKRAGKSEVTPLYTMSDVEKTLKLMVPCEYGNINEAGSGIKFSFVDAGHILSSASVEISLTEGGKDRKIVFSGDIGNTRQPIIKDPQYINEADYMVMESTYGDRKHEKSDDYALELAGIMERTLKARGNVIIPSFALGRMQGLLYIIREIKERGLVKNSDFPVYVDSPMASEVTKVYEEDLRAYADMETKGIAKKGVNPLTFKNLRFTNSTRESIVLNNDPEPKVIISSSGMCEGGRIGHHLKHNLWKEECALVFVGFQAYGTLGRILLDGAKKVEIFGEKIAVKANIYNFTGLSAHADRDGLLKWIKSFKRKPEKVFIAHGEDSVCDIFAGALNDMGFSTVSPLYKSVYDLSNGKPVSEGVEIGKEEYRAEEEEAVRSAYAKLLGAGRKLSKAIRYKKDAEDKELENFAEEIDRLAGKWK
ncbi:MAG: MBL fold metallo-hydrolase [Actinomycetota bacterium]|nr:MBL fold metallo-hydrolase [Actinomycetota bacterium]